MWISTRIELDALLLVEEALVGRDARLRLRLTGLRARPHPLELALQRAPAGGRLLLLGGEARLLLLEPRRVVALEGDPAAAIELEDPAGHVVEEVAVVRDRDHGAPVLGQEALEPRDGLGVEVVRRLVEQQQVGGGEEEPAERHAPPLAARERSDVLIAGRAAKRVHRRVERLVEAPRVVAVDLLLEPPLLLEQGVEVGIRLGELRRDHVEAVEQVAQRTHPVLDVAAHVPGRVELGLLREKADRCPGRELRDARGGLVEPRHDA